MLSLLTNILPSPHALKSLINRFAHLIAPHFNHPISLCVVQLYIPLLLLKIRLTLTLSLIILLTLLTLLPSLRNLLNLIIMIPL
jgi:hypothetical protein